MRETELMREETRKQIRVLLWEAKQHLAHLLITHPDGAPQYVSRLIEQAIDLLNKD